MSMERASPGRWCARAYSFEGAGRKAPGWRDASRAGGITRLLTLAEHARHPRAARVAACPAVVRGRIQVRARAGTVGCPRGTCAMATDTDQVAAAELRTETAVVLVVGQIDAHVAASREPWTASALTVSAAADCPDPASVAAAAAVGCVRLQIRAQKERSSAKASEAALGFTRGARTCAADTRATEGAHVPAAAAVRETRLLIDARPAAKR